MRKRKATQTYNRAPLPTEMSKKQSDNTKTTPKSSTTQRLRTDLGRSVKPQSDIHCNRSVTSPRPKFKTIAEVAEEWQLGFVGGRGLVGDLIGTSLRLDATGRRPIGDRSPTKST